MKVTREIRKDKVNSKGYAPIRMIACYDGKRARISAEEQVLLDGWDKRFQKVKSTEPYFQRINDKLDLWEKHLLAILAKAHHNGISLTEEELKSQFALALNPPAEPDATQDLVSSLLGIAPAVVPAPAAFEDPNSFFKLMERWITYKETTLDEFGRSLSPSTVQALRATKERFEKFEQKKAFKMELAGMNLVFYDAFKLYLIKDKGQSINTFSKHIGRLKDFLDWCEDDGHYVNRRYTKFATPESYGDVDFLTEEEIQKIYALDFITEETVEFLKAEFLAEHHYPMNRLFLAQAITTLEHCRDIFLFCCYTGLRISDVFDLKPKDIRGQLIIKMAGKTEKHRSVSYIPYFDDHIFKPVELVKKYEGQQETCLPIHRDINQHLKTIAKLAGITRLNLVTKIGRKTFCTLKLYQGVPRHVVMQATGHKTERSFNAYIGVDTLKVIQTYLKHSAEAGLGGQF